MMTVVVVLDGDAAMVHEHHPIDSGTRRTSLGPTVVVACRLPPPLSVSALVHSCQQCRSTLIADQRMDKAWSGRRDECTVMGNDSCGDQSGGQTWSCDCSPTHRNSV